MIERSAILYGGDFCAALKNAVAAVCGAGAVGSFAVEALARLGVGSFLLYDFDAFELSNINRQLCALRSTIGAQKVDAQKARILDINPDAKVEANNVFIDADVAARVAARRPSVIIDAVDCVAAKVALAKAAAAEGVPFVASMGAARRKNPLAVKTADIYATTGCPLAARLRKELRKAGVKGFKCVYSDEAAAEGTHVNGGQDGADGGRNFKKIIGSSVIVTGVFGLNLANLAIREIAKGNF